MLPTFLKFRPTRGTPNEVKAFWINVYNVNIVKLFAENYPLKSINYIRDPFQMKFISFDGEQISLNYIANEILKPFDDARIHFALYTTAISSPILKNTAFSAETLENDLNASTSLYINDPTKNSIMVKKASLSKIFEWNITDFVGKNNIVSFINTFSQVNINEETTISFTEFNWNLNK